MKLIPIKVECHSGYKADEYPKCFYWNSQRFEIEEISDRWYQGDRDPESPVADYFKVYTAYGRQYLIKHEVESDEWYLIIRSENEIC
jgi:hypothetical protein